VTIQNVDFFVITNETVGNVVTYGTTLLYIDIVHSRTFPNTRTYIAIDPQGNITPLFENQLFNNARVVSELSNLPPPKNLLVLEEIMRLPTVSLKEAYDTIKNILKKVVVFHDPYYYDLVTAYCIYTWLRGLFHKNVNLYVVGFPATGKSQVAQFIKKFARYPIDYGAEGEKSFKWYIAQTLGVLVIDEAEYLSKQKLAKLRKYHELTFETKLVGMQFVGLTQVVLRVDAPIVISATHVPSDIAFLQRGFLIRMRKGNPEVKSLMYIEDLDETRLIAIKSILCNWAEIYNNILDVVLEVKDLEIDERAKDIAIPIMTVLKSVGSDYRWVLDYALRSIREAFYVTPENIVYTMLLMKIREQAKVEDNYYVIEVDKVYEIARDLAKKFFASESKVKYLLQYLYSGCQIESVEGKLCYVCDKNTVDHVIELATM